MVHRINGDFEAESIIIALTKPLKVFWKVGLSTVINADNLRQVEGQGTNTWGQFHYLLLLAGSSFDGNEKEKREEEKWPEMKASSDDNHPLRSSAPFGKQNSWNGIYKK